MRYNNSQPNAYVDCQPQGAARVAARVGGVTMRFPGAGDHTGSPLAHFGMRPIHKKGATAMKRETTNEIIANSFRELAARKPVDKITVGEIVSNCNLSAPTFYRHFHDKYDLITWIYGQEVSKYVLRSDNPPPGHDEVLAAWVDYCMKNSALLTNLMKNTDGYDSFLRNMVKEHVRIVEDDITSRNGPEAITKKTHLMIYTFSCGMVRLMFAWLTGGVSATQEEIFEVINDSFPEPIQRLVTPPHLKRDTM